MQQCLGVVVASPGQLRVVTGVAAKDHGVLKVGYRYLRLALGYAKRPQQPVSGDLAEEKDSASARFQGDILLLSFDCIAS